MPHRVALQQRVLNERAKTLRPACISLHTRSLYHTHTSYHTPTMHLPELITVMNIVMIITIALASVLADVDRRFGAGPPQHGL